MVKVTTPAGRTDHSTVENIEKTMSETHGIGVSMPGTTVNEYLYQLWSDMERVIWGLQSHHASN